MGAFDLGKLATVSRCYQRQDGKWNIEVKSGKAVHQIVHAEALSAGKSVKLTGAGQRLKIAG